jgi:hypothetical protein
MQVIGNKLTEGNSEKYKLSIRLRSDGLSFSGYIPSEPDSAFREEVNFDTNTSFIAALKEYFFANDFLSRAFAEVRIFPFAAPYTLVPQALFDDKRKDAFATFNFSHPEHCTLYNVPDEEEAVLLFAMDNEVYEFCSRSFIHPLFVHPVTPLLAFCHKQSRVSLPRRMYAFVHGKTTDIICYDKGNLVLANTFATEITDDILYYILYVWRQTGFDQERDELHLSVPSGTDAYAELSGILHTYLRHIRPVEQVTEDVKASLCVS